MTPAQLRQEVIAEAYRLGFCAAGVAAVRQIETAEIFDRWLKSGSNAGLDYMTRHQQLRLDPCNLLPSARSVIVVAARYPHNLRPGTGFSTYARGNDYHDVIRAKLRELEAFIRKASNAKAFRICVDSAPLAERDWALAAGIGWRGRQGQIINSEHGSAILLGELLVDIELEPSEPAENKCGACAICQNACPTGALGLDGLVDCRKCISYLTIEHKEEFNPAREAGTGQALFGCDICTAVCPWNRKGLADPVMPELCAREMPDAEAILKMTEAEFDTFFKASPVHRTGLSRLQRNARAALAGR